MKLVEVVVLLGAHCISPLQNSGAATEAGKVQCAVVIEKDTTAGTIRIVPAGASRHPEVAAVLNRMDATLPSDASIEPANALPTASAAVRAPLAAATPPPQPLAAAGPPPAPPKPAAVKEEAKVTETEAPATNKAADKEKKAAPDKDQAEAKSANQCIGGAKPKWYTNAEGRRKYRCVKAG